MILRLLQRSQVREPLRPVPDVRGQGRNGLAEFTEQWEEATSRARRQ